MALSTTLTKQDLDALGWATLISDCGNKECHAYSSIFNAKAHEAQAAGNPKHEAAFALLSALASLHLKPDSANEPFGPMAVFSDFRTAVVDDFTDQQLDVLGEILPEVADPEMKSRIADVLWLRKRDIKVAEIAIDAYLRSAAVLLDPAQWSACAKRIERAFRLAASLGNAGFLPKVVQYIEGLLDKCNGEDPLFLSNKMMTLLLEVRHGDAGKYSVLAEKLACRAAAEKDWYRARAYRETQANWYALAKHQTKERTARIELAETYVKEAEASATKEPPSYIAAAVHQQSAIEAYRRIGGMGERIEQLHQELLGYQQKSLGEMQSFSSKVDLSEETERAIERVKGMSFYDALVHLALIAKSPDLSRLRRQVEEAANEHPIQHLFPQVAVNELGKVVGRIPNLLSRDPEERESAIAAHMFKQAGIDHLVSTHGFIEPTRWQINLEHHIRIDDLLPLCSNHPLIPEGREYLYAQGFLAGMEGNFFIAAHLLIPQFENSMRFVLTNNGVITSGINDGIQDERSLNTTLDHEIAIEIFGEDIVFDLKGLLIERFGSNLRNRLAHGLMSLGDFYSVEVRYFWWLMLRLVLLPWIAKLSPALDLAQTHAPNSQADVDEPSDGAGAPPDAEKPK